MRLLLVAAVAAAAFLPAAPARAAASTDVCAGYIDAVPATIATPGTWCLRKNLTTAITAGAAIAIDADAVTLDCNDFRITGTGIGYTDGVSSHNDDVTVRNCNLRGFETGIFIVGADPLVEDTRVETANTGMWIVASGVSAKTGAATVRRNTIVDAKDLGIEVDGNGAVLDNTIDGVGGGTPGDRIGILTFDDGVTIAGNRLRNIESDGGDAIGIIAEGDMSVVRDNVLVALPAAVGAGIVCNGTRSITHDNQIVGWPTAVSSCATSHDDIVLP